MKEVGLMHPEGDAFFHVLPDTVLYAVWSTASGTVRVQGFTSTGEGWAHEDKVSPELLARWFMTPPFCHYSLVGMEATDLLLVDVATRKACVAPKDGVAHWTWHILSKLREPELPSPTRFH